MALHKEGPALYYTLFCILRFRRLKNSWIQAPHEIRQPGGAWAPRRSPANMIRTMLAGRIHRAGDICVDGAARLLVHERDLIIILHFVRVGHAEARCMEPKVVRVNVRNRIISTTNKVEA